MNTIAPTALSLAAAAIYLGVLLSCLFAGLEAMKQRRSPWHWRIWFAIAALFGLFAVVRGLALEELMRDHLRAEFFNDGLYEQRRNVQRPIAAFAIAIAAALVLLVPMRFAKSFRSRRGLAVFAACASALAMVFLRVMRLISLHQIDALLYGPLKLNWIIDLGASLMVAAAAAVFITGGISSRRGRRGP